MLQYLLNTAITADGQVTQAHLI